METAFVTHKELTRTQDKLKKELLDSQKTVKDELEKKIDKMDNKVEKVDDKITGLDDKVDHLRDLVLPLLEASKQTAENTKQMVMSFNEFAKTQRKTNGILHEKSNNQAITIEGLKHMAGGANDKKKYNAGIMIAAITAIGGIIVGIFQLAPFIFN